MTATMHKSSVHDSIDAVTTGSADTGEDGQAEEASGAGPDSQSDGRSERTSAANNADTKGELTERRTVGRPDTGACRDGLEGLSATAPKATATGGVSSRRRTREPDRVYVPGYGWVAWSEPLLDAQARYLSLIHRPTPRQVRYRWRWRIIPVRETERQRCRFCGQEWKCAEAAWAEARLGPESSLRVRRRRVPGRHRARLFDRLTVRH